MATVCLLAAAGAGWFFVYRDTPPLRQLAAAYSTHRNLELQIPGAAFAPLRSDRSAASGRDLPLDLLASLASIQRHMDKEPDSPEWLHAQGRAALLQGDFDVALHSFQVAEDLGAGGPGFLVDFGSAYFERAERNENPLDYALALEKTGQALRNRSGPKGCSGAMLI